ncbi:MAG: hypothetical protein ACT4O3_09870 [Elusimicrobiota bacterium]
MTGPRARAFLGGAGLAVLLAAGGGGGCARGYHSALAGFRGHLRQGDLEKALADANRLLGVKSAEEAPQTLGPDTALHLLERGSVLQTRGEYALSSRDFQLADDNLEVLRLSGNAGTVLAKYLYSESKTPYKALPHEKVLLNTLNMINYLVRADLSGARVEARRLRAAEEFIEDSQGAKKLSALGAYLAGFTFEMSGETGAALQFYADAHERGGVPGLEDAVRRVHARTGASNRRLEPLLKNAPPRAEDEGQGSELLVLVGLGLAPRKVPEIVPIGLIVADLATAGGALTDDQVKAADSLAAEGLVKWLVYPKIELEAASYETVGLRLDGAPLRTAEAMDVQALVLRDFEEKKGAYQAAALTRLLTRFAAGEGVESLTRQGNAKQARTFGLLTQGLLTLLDKPDTRAWTSLPGSFHLARRSVPAGAYDLTVRLEGPAGPRVIEEKVEVPARGFKVVYVRS